MTATDLDRALTIVDIAICLVDMVLVIMLYRQRTSVAPRPSTLALAFRRVMAARHTRPSALSLASRPRRRHGGP